MESQSLHWTRALAYLAAWLVSSALLVVDTLVVRSAVLAVLMWLGAHRPGGATAYSNIGWFLEFADQTLLLILGCVGVGLAVAVEYYYRHGAERGLLARRALRVLASQVAVVAIGWLLQVLTRLV